MAEEDRLTGRFPVLANFAFHSACNGFMWMDYSTVSDSASAAIGVDLPDINTLYSVGFMAAIPSIIFAMCFLDKCGWVTMLGGTSATVICAWLRFAAVWKSSYSLALGSSVGLGVGVGVVFTGFARIPALWFETGPEQAMASAITVQSNFFGWAMGGIIVPWLVGSPHDLYNFTLVQAVVVSFCLPAFFLLHRERKAQVAFVLAPNMELSGLGDGEDFMQQRSKSLEKVRNGSFGDVAADPVAREAACAFLFNWEYIMQGLGCALFQAVGFTIPGVQEEIFVEEGYSPKTCSWTGFAFIISGVILGMLLGKFAPSHDRPAAAYTLILVLVWGGTLALGSLQLVYWYGGSLGYLGRYWTYLSLMAMVGATSLGFLGVHLPVVCSMAEPVSESLSGGFVELLGQLLGSVLTSSSTGRQFQVCGAAAFAAAVCISIAPPKIHTDSQQAALVHMPTTKFQESFTQVSNASPRSS